MLKKLYFIQKLCLGLLLANSCWALDASRLPYLGTGFGQFNTVTVVIFGVVLVLGVALLVYLEMRRVSQYHQIKSRIGWQKFEELVLEKNLREDDLVYFRKILQNMDLPSADLAVTSALVFENTLEEWYKQRGKLEDEEWEMLYRIRHAFSFDELPDEMPLISTRHIKENFKVTLISQSGAPVMTTVMEKNEKEWLLQNTLKEEVKVGRELQMLVTRQGDGEYLIKTNVISVSSDYIAFDHTRNMMRKQLRSWVRVDVSYPVKIRMKEILENENIHNGDVVLARLSDISGGGASVRMTQKLSNNDILLLNFDLPKNSLRNVEAKVTRVVNTKSPDAMISHSLEFVNLDTQQREKIVRFVFDKQRQDTQWR